VEDFFNWQTYAIFKHMPFSKIFQTPTACKSQGTGYREQGIVVSDSLCGRFAVK